MASIVGQMIIGGLITGITFTSASIATSEAISGIKNLIEKPKEFTLREAPETHVNKDVHLDAIYAHQRYPELRHIIKKEMKTL